MPMWNSTRRVFDKLTELLAEYDLEKVERITGVAKSDIERAARLFAATKPASIMNGNGLEHHTNTVQTLRALSLLLSITGNIDIKGGNAFLAPLFFNPEQPEGMSAPEGSPLRHGGASHVCKHDQSGSGPCGYRENPCSRDQPDKGAHSCGRRSGSGSLPRYQ